MVSAAALLLLASAAVAARTPPKPEAAPPRVLVIGLDGADLSTIDRLVAEGVQLPNLGRLLSQGYSAPVAAFDPVLSPPLWTTIATGRSPADHGIWDFLELSPAGEPMPATSNSRKVRAFWNVAADNDVSVAVLGWYASWPAEKVRGAVVTDRMVEHQVVSGETPTEGLTFPTDLAGDLSPLRPSLDDARKSVLGRFVRGPVPSASLDRLEALARSWQGSEFLARSWPKVIARAHPSIAAIYIDLPDAAGHLFADAAPPRLAGTSDADATAFADVWSRTYVYVDELLGELLREAGPTTTTILCSDHGFKDGADRPRRSGRVKTGMAGLWHRRNGLLVIGGPGVRRGVRRAQPISIDDVFPTILAVAGLPLSKQLPGKFPADAFTSIPKVAWVDTYEAKPRPKPRLPELGKAGRDENLRRLRALGYLGGNETPPAGEKSGRTARSILNEGVYWMSAGQPARAVPLFREALRLDGRLDDARISLASTLANSGEIAAARMVVDEIPAGREALPAVLIRGNLDVAAGKIAEGCLAAEEASALDDRDPGVWLLRARCSFARGEAADAIRFADQVEQGADLVADADEARRIRSESLEKLGRREEAIAAARVRLESTPTVAAALLLGDLFVRAGRGADAAEAFDRAARLAPESPWPHLRAGLLRLGGEQLELAEKSYRLALDHSPAGRPRELARLGLVLVAVGRRHLDVARRMVEEGLGEFPGSAPILEQAGLLEARARNFARAVEHFERAVSIDKSARLLGEYAVVLAAAGRRQEALAAARSSLDLDPAQPLLKGLVGELEGGRSR